MVEQAMNHLDQNGDEVMDGAEMYEASMKGQLGGAGPMGPMGYGGAFGGHSTIDKNGDGVVDAHEMGEAMMKGQVGAAYGYGHPMVHPGYGYGHPGAGYGHPAYHPAYQQMPVRPYVGYYPRMGPKNMMIDKNGDGVRDQKELGEAMRSGALQGGPQMTPWNPRKILDQNGDGVVDNSEVVDGMMEGQIPLAGHPLQGYPRGAYPQGTYHPADPHHGLPMGAHHHHHHTEYPAYGRFVRHPKYKRYMGHAGTGVHVDMHKEQEPSDTTIDFETTLRVQSFPDKHTSEQQWDHQFAYNHSLAPKSVASRAELDCKDNWRAHRVKALEKVEEDTKDWLGFAHFYGIDPYNEGATKSLKRAEGKFGPSGAPLGWGALHPMHHAEMEAHHAMEQKSDDMIDSAEAQQAPVNGQQAVMNGTQPGYGYGHLGYGYGHPGMHPSVGPGMHPSVGPGMGGQPQQSRDEAECPSAEGGGYGHPAMGHPGMYENSTRMDKYEHAQQALPPHYWTGLHGHAGDHPEGPHSPWGQSHHEGHHPHGVPHMAPPEAAYTAYVAQLGRHVDTHVLQEMPNEIPSKPVRIMKKNAIAVNTHVIRHSPRADKRAGLRPVSILDEVYAEVGRIPLEMKVRRN